MADRANVLPSELQRLLDAPRSDNENAWAALVATYSRLLMAVAHDVTPDHDTAMDSYAHLLDRLREDNYRRLRGYVADGRGAFSTWLVVVARRLCVDYYRQRYGRAPRGQGDPAIAREERASRRRLFDLSSAGVDLLSIIDATSASPDAAMQLAQRDAALVCAMTSLDPADRLLLKLRFEDDLSAREIADVLRFPSAFHVYRRLAAVYASLRRVLQARGVEGSTP